MFKKGLDMRNKKYYIDFNKGPIERELDNLKRAVQIGIIVGCILSVPILIYIIWMMVRFL